jgi:fumarate reductase flavoprotein subunit
MLDLVVIGGGLAGLSCAVRAAELGAEVLLLEQGREEHYACNSRYSGGMFHLDYHDIGMPVESLVTSLTGRCPDDVDRELVGVIARNARRCVDWLQTHGGARFVRVGPNAYEKWVLAPPRPPKPGLVHPGRGPDVVLTRLAAALVARGMRLQRGAKAVDVRCEADGFVVTTLHGGEFGELSHTATRAVVFADGGFQANPELVTRHITPDRAGLLQRNAETGKGSCLDIATRLGAEISELRSFYGHLVSRDALNDPGLWPYPMIDGLAKAGILVGPDGKRFADEGRSGVYLANQVARRANATDPMAIFDDSTWWSVGRQTRVPPNPVLTNHGGRLWSAASIDELAVIAGIDPLGLRRTIEAHNAFLGRESVEPLDPVRTCGALKPAPIVTPPFHAVPLCAGITYTMGGIRVTDRAEVRAGNGGVIRGLFAAGAAVGGIEGGAGAFYVGGLCKALVLGILAAESAAAQLGKGVSTPAAAAWTQGVLVNEH